MTTPTITGFKASPDRGKGLARDLHVRWALEEVGQPYDVRLLTFAEMKQSAHRALQPFGQIPTYEDGEVAIFETGAIVLRLAETHNGLLPSDPAKRARAISWMFSALSTIEPVVVQREIMILMEQDRDWFEPRLGLVLDRIRARLTDLSAALGDKDWLEGEFTAGDLLTIEVLRRLKSSDLLPEFPNLAAYVARGEARPAFRRAFDAQHKVFEQAEAAKAAS